jgi:RecA-family ATPase
MVEGFIPAASLGVVWGHPGTFKSFLTLSVCCSVAAGKDWMGQDVPHQRQAVYIAAEGMLDLDNRIEAWEHNAKVRTFSVENGQRRDNLFIWPHSLAVFDTAVVLDFKAQIEQRGIRPGILVVDTLSRCLMGEDENSSSSVERVVASLEMFRDAWGCSCILVHHSNKAGDNMRGSGAIKGAVDFEYEVQREGGSSALTVWCRKIKSAREPDPINLITEPFKDSLVLRRVTR